MFYPRENSFLGGSPFVFPVAWLRFLERKTWDENRGWDIGRCLKIEGPGHVFERRQKRVPRFQWGKRRRKASWGNRRRGCCSVLGDDKIVSASGIARALPEVSRFFDFPTRRIYTSYSFPFLLLCDSFSKRNRLFKDRYRTLLLLNYRKHSVVKIYSHSRFLIHSVTTLYFFLVLLQMWKCIKFFFYYSSTRFFSLYRIIFYFVKYRIYLVSRKMKHKAILSSILLTYIYIVKIILTKGINDTVGQVVGETMRCNASIAPSIPFLRRSKTIGNIFGRGRGFVESKKEQHVQRSSVTFRRWVSTCETSP